MLLSHSSSLFYPHIKLSERKYSTKTNMPFSTNTSKMNSFSMKNDDMPYYKRNSCFTGHCHMPPSDLPAAVADDEDVHAGAGLGILEFFQGKNIFVTGATGLFGKVIVEKILRSTSVGKVYLLIKAKDRETALDRLKREIISSELFRCLKEKYGTSYEGFVREKLIPIAGDICEPNMGMDYECIEAIRKDVHVIIHSAACTNFNERYDLVVDANVIAPQRVMRFAKTCTKLKLFTHISTAYVNGRRDLEGIILEKPLIMGENGLDVTDELSLLLKSSPDSDNATNFFTKLGQQRAEMLGWNNAYQVSKAMGEMALNEIRGIVPLLIIRPAVIESCYREPLLGWIQGIRMFEPLLISYGKGLLPAYFGNPQVPLDLIPVDLVANTTIAAIAKHGNTNMPQINVYHTASALWNPITFLDAFEYLYEYFKAAPLIKNANIAKVKFFNDFDEFSKCIKEEIFRNNGVVANGVGEDKKLVRQCKAKAEYAQSLCKTYEFASFFKARFYTGNTQKLIEEMSREEQLNFEVDVRNIDWKKYFLEIYVPGVKKYVINSMRAESTT